MESESGQLSHGRDQLRGRKETKPQSSSTCKAVGAFRVKGLSENFKLRKLQSGGNTYGAAVSFARHRTTFLLLSHA